MKILYDVPDVLYKFRDWNNKNSQKLLFERELFFSSYTNFNDPFDGGIPFQYDPAELTPDNIFMKLLEVGRRAEPNLNETELHEKAFRLQKDGVFLDEAWQENWRKEWAKAFAEDYGIVCLCKSPMNFLLWSYYSESHRGFAIGFDKYRLFEDTQASFAHMIYQDQLPTIGLFEDAVPAIIKLLGTKSSIWQHEDEYRLIKIGFSNRTITLRPETIVDITLGCKMDHAAKMQIIAYVKKDLPHATVHEMAMSKAKFELVRNKIM